MASTSAPTSAAARPTDGAPPPDSGASPSATTRTPPTSAPGPTLSAREGGVGDTLPPGSTLPDDVTCAGRVVPAPEVRPQNERYNARRGSQKNLPGTWQARVTGDYAGTTDEILQWVACKWGIDADIVRAQAAKESYWTMTNMGDFTSNPADCPPGHDLGADGRKGQCPESVGLLQVRYRFHGPPAGLDTWPDAEESTAYNADYTYSIWRTCYEGGFEWLNTVERGADYASGDVWGCVGLWFTGRWRTPAAEEYIRAVQDYVDARVWTKNDFVNYR